MVQNECGLFAKIRTGKIMSVSVTKIRWKKCKKCQFVTPMSEFSIFLNKEVFTNILIFPLQATLPLPAALWPFKKLPPPSDINPAPDSSLPDTYPFLQLHSCTNDYYQASIPAPGSSLPNPCPFLHLPNNPRHQWRLRQWRRSCGPWISRFHSKLAHPFIAAFVNMPLVVQHQTLCTEGFKPISLNQLSTTCCHYCDTDAHHSFQSITYLSSYLSECTLSSLAVGSKLSNTTVSPYDIQKSWPMWAK